ncbi:MAG: cadherin domain-containing protein, partial [Granulosicoccus sp.]
MTFRSGKRLRATNIAKKSELTDPVGAYRRSMAPSRTLIDVLEPRLLFSVDHPLGLPVSSADFQEFYRQVDDAEVAALSLDMVHVMDYENSDNRGSSTSDQGKNEASSDEVKSSVARISDVELEVIVDEYVFEYRVDSRPMLADDPPALNIIYVTTTNDIVDADNLSSFVAFNNGAGGDNEVSLREAVIVANADPDVDLISLPDGIFSLTQDAPTTDDDASQYGDLDLVGDFEIQGSAENNTSIRQTFTDLRVFDLHSGAVTISDLTILDGSTEAGENGAGILIHSGASAVFENVSFINNDAAADNGGAIYAAGDATLDNVTITGSNAIRGAGIYSEATATVVVRDSTISNNTVMDLLGASGGGIYALGPLEVYDSLFQSNAANSGTDASSGPVASETRGGAIYVASTSTAVIENSVFSNNSARSDGGAIYNNGTLTLTGTSLNFNSVGRWGGGLSSLGDVTVVDSTIWANSTNGPEGHLPSGGGIHIFEGGTLDMRNSIVSQNTSIAYTGGIHLEGIATITGSTIVNNTSNRDNDNEGRGGISTDIKGGGNVLVLTDSLVANNFAGTDEDDFFAANANDVESGGGNLIEFETDFDTQPSDSIGVDPGIASIQLVNNRAQITYVDAPVISSNGGGNTAALLVATNQPIVTIVTAVSDVGKSHAFSVGGPDAGAFTIDSATGELVFNTVPDPAIKDKYTIDVIATDSATSYLTDTQMLSITVYDANVAPTIISDGGGAAASVSADENQTTVTTVVATDADIGSTLTYSHGGTDAAAFTIDSATGVLTFNTAPDHELKSLYEVDVIVTDGGALTDTQTLSITVNDVNEAPVITSNGGGATAPMSVDENQTAVTTVVATDVDDSDTPSYSLGGTDAAAFTIDSATGVLTFNTAPDHELNSSYEVDVIVTDGGSLTDMQTLTITVNDVNEAPVITSNGGGAAEAVTVDENQTAVTTVVASDVDDSDTQSYSVAGTDAASFTIDNATGVLTFNAAPDHELKSSYEVDVIVTDG